MGEPSARRALRRVRRPLHPRVADPGVPAAGGGVPRGLGATPVFRARFDALLRDYAGRPTPVTECPRLSERLGVRVLLKREDLTHTGSHKINNVIGQGLLTLRHGQAPHDRRDRRRPARGGHRHRGRPVRARMRRLHGRGGHRAPGPQRVPDASAGRRGAAGALRQPDAQGRGQRGAAGLGGDGGGHPLLPGLGHGAPPLPLDGAGVPAGGGGRGPGRSAGPCSAAPTRTTWSPAWAAAPTRPAPSPASSTPRPSWSASRPPGARPSAGACPAWCTA